MSGKYRNKCPHTNYSRGKHVRIRMVSGETVIGKFVERRGRFVVLDCGRFSTRDIRAMGFAPLAVR